MPTAKKPSTARRKKSKSLPALLAYLDKIDKKLDLFNVLGRTMPVVILSTTALLISIFYLSYVAKIPEITSELPKTGEETTSDFVILYPEHLSVITLPDDIIGLSVNGYFTQNEKVEFIARNTARDLITIGEGQKGTQNGEYKINWQNASSGRYILWAQITKQDGTKTTSNAITVDVK